MLTKLLTIILSFCIGFGLLAQNLNEEDISKMSWEELHAYQKVLQVKMDSQKNTMPSASRIQEYAEVGKSLGQAFKECWTVVSSDAEKFAQSPAGKWTAFLITWKVMGRDAIDLTKTFVRWIVGVGLLIIGVPFLAYNYYANCIRKPISKIERTGLFKCVKEYSGSYTNHSGNELLHGLFFLAFVGVICIIMFA